MKYFLESEFFKSTAYSPAVVEITVTSITKLEWYRNKITNFMKLNNVSHGVLPNTKPNKFKIVSYIMWQLQEF